jgi:hypothetical protein
MSRYRVDVNDDLWPEFTFQSLTWQRILEVSISMKKKTKASNPV